MANAITLQAPAKVNLVLRVLGRRADGYHELETLFERIGLCDALELRSQPSGLTLTTRGEPVPAGEDNLVMRAARLMATRLPPDGRRGVAIRLTKRIPVGAGLGGGSSDAAAVLLGLNRLWGLHLPRARLIALGAELGSDVPFFLLESSFALGRGRGELLERVIGLPRFWHLVVWPRRRRLLTASVYRAWDQGRGGFLTRSLALRANPERLSVEGLTSPRPNIKMILASFQHPGLRSFDGGVTNELVPNATRLLPEIQSMMQGLRCGGLPVVTMSGSGPAVLGIAKRRDVVEAAAHWLQRWQAPWRWAIAATC